MIYLSKFVFASIEQEEDFRFALRRTCYDTVYPFGVLTGHGLRQLDFEPITILYGGNGSGKTTALNVISEKLGLNRDTLYNRTNFYEDYLNYCSFDTEHGIPSESRIITSDDVFDFMLNLRSINEGVDKRRDDALNEYLEGRYNGFQMKSLEDYDRLKKVNLARTKTQSRYVRATTMPNIREHSNGESAYLYFEERIKEDALYLMDEPENSLSAERQQELVQLIENSARFFGCQFIIATHSPFVLSMKGAKIYDFDENPVDVKKWTQLSAVREYYEFFKKHENEFG